MLVHPFKLRLVNKQITLMHACIRYITTPFKGNGVLQYDRTHTTSSSNAVIIDNNGSPRDGQVVKEITQYKQRTSNDGNTLTCYMMLDNNTYYTHAHTHTHTRTRTHTHTHSHTVRIGRTVAGHSYRRPIGRLVYYSNVTVLSIVNVLCITCY